MARGGDELVQRRSDERYGGFWIHLALATAVAFVMYGCESEGIQTEPDVDVINETSRVLILHFEPRPAEASGIDARVNPGSVQGLYFPPGTVTDECTDSDLIAESETGRVVARKTSPICRGDTWTVTA
jgi:hypothetical protein